MDRVDGPILIKEEQPVLIGCREAVHCPFTPKIVLLHRVAETASPTMTERCGPVEIDTGDECFCKVALSANGEYLVSGRFKPEGGVQVWRVEDGKKMATMEASEVNLVAVSKDGSRIAAGTSLRELFVWNAETYQQIFKAVDKLHIRKSGVDFSLDATRLVVGSRNYSASVWDIAASKLVLLLRHDNEVNAVKYSSQGDRIAAITQNSVRVWDSSDGRLFFAIKVDVIPWLRGGLFWFDNHLLIASTKIKQIDTYTGSVVSEWPVPGTDLSNACFTALPKHSKYIIYSTERTVTFWDISTHTHLGLIQHPQDICSIAVSLDGRFLAIGGCDGKVVIKSLSRIIPSTHEQGHQDGQPSTSEGRPGSDPVGFAYCDPTLRQRLCEALYTAGRTKDAVECFNQMMRELGGETNLRDGYLVWTLDFRQRSFEKMAHLGDTAVDAQRHDEAISHYTAALSLNPPTPQGILIKRSKAFLVSGAWKQAVHDADEVIKLDPSSPWAYEIKHAALNKAGQYGDAVDAFEMMLSKMAQSPDPEVQQRGDQYISPSTTRAMIRKIVQRATRHLPRVLINTTTGRLHSKTEQTSAFESLPIFNELVLSMTTRIDYVRIKCEVRQYFRYVMLSHKWEDNEPLFQQVIHIAVYDLDKSPTHDKLQTFCKIVRDGGFDWAWSDTCCIDKSDNFVLQEALVAMFKWYQGSALAIVFLRGVRSSSLLGALVRSVWNTRAWTLQEYVAAKVIHFYTEDWTPYLNLELSNHKESTEVISEMEQATGLSAEQLMALRPGLNSIQEKLHLASTRQTTLVEDAAYSLLGILSVTGLSAIYGEGEASLGRLLANVLTCSGDVSILAWIGESGSFNSCLPAHITAFDRRATSHLPSPIPDTEMEGITTTSYSSSFDLDAAVTLYDRLDELSAPWFAASRMKLPCIAVKLSALSPYRTRTGRLYRTDTAAFGRVEITTRQDLSRMKTLYLVHPWLDALLEPEDIHSGDDVPPPSPNTDDGEISDDSSPLPEPELLLHDAPEHVVPIDDETRARRFVARLGQPFGAILLAPVASGRRGTDYKRVAADSLIMARFQDNVSLADILDNVRTLDVL